MIEKNLDEIREYCRRKALPHLCTITYDWEETEIDEVIEEDVREMCNWLGVEYVEKKDKKVLDNGVCI